MEKKAIANSVVLCYTETIIAVWYFVPTDIVYGKMQEVIK